MEFLEVSKQLLSRAHDRLGTRPADGEGGAGAVGGGTGNAVSNAENIPATPSASSGGPGAGGGGAGAGGLPARPSTAGGSIPAGTLAENQNRRWLEEMDIGYRSLVTDIHPYIKDICDIAQFLESK